MKVMSFAEINDLENGQQVSSFQGTIKKVFDQKSDVGQYGQWWLQNIILQDDHANELTVTWTIEDAWTPKDEGKQLLFEAGRDKKDQLVGIKREIKTKGQKRYESVKVDDRAKVHITQQNGQPAGAIKDLQDADPHGQHGEIDGPPLIDRDWPESPPITTKPTRPLPVPFNTGLDQRQRAIIRQHSQSMALEVLKLKVTLNELTVADLTPSKLKALADYFDEDVLGASQ